MLFKLPTFALTLALLSVQIQARGPPALMNVGQLISPSHGQTFKVGHVLSFEYRLDVPGPGPAYQLQLQHTDGTVISTFATEIVADNITGIIAANFLVPKPHNIPRTSGSVDAQFAVLQYTPVEDTKDLFNYQLVQEVALNITS